ncbi:methyltransferase domain-containing protein [Halioglobus maricola]|uniref:Methyltransferase domain-containing protein n=1 Tax=Halioglobus maricola TaxID=2601894 RepID=A0A5P9NFM3_9GAMM|nr:methyltransferase domain-containing protein [Halioglobus maricola]QFU74603.1 methyltransferase domain-containing protein [Halioglobus maricola]
MTKKRFANISRVGGTLREMIAHGRVALVNRYYDFRHGTDTAAHLYLNDFQVPEEALEHAIWYAPIGESSLRQALSALPIDSSEYQFIDIGCGKGRALLTASEFPFSTITGVEFEPGLAAIARRNIENARIRHQQCHQLQVLTEDARDYAIPHAACIFFLYTPFTGELLKQVLRNIREAALSSAQPMVIMFLDDVVPGSLAPPVREYLAQWPGWEALPAPDTRDLGHLYALDWVIFRTQQEPRK